jgi:diguanylate cyclase (GGDEF)-like protein
VLKGLAVALGIFALLLSFLNIYLQDYLLAAVEVLLSLSCWVIFRKIQKDSLSLAQAMILPYFFVLIVIYGTYIKLLSSGLLLWSFIIPTIFYLLFGKKHGFYAALIVGVVQVINILSKDEVELYITGRVGFNFLLAYISIWIISHVYESYRENAQNTLSALALKDPLTDANNRRGFAHKFDDSVKLAGEFSIVLLDIDFFKKVNDRYGHEAGDLVLVEFTKTLIQFLGDEKVFRMGGEEFVLLIPESMEKACSIAEEILQAVEKQKIHYKKDIISITFSAGISQCTPEKSMGIILSEADQSLYKAKHDGRNQIGCFD